MGITFDVPIALLLLPALLAVVIALHLSSRRRLGKGRRRAALAVRGLLLACLVGALAGLQLVLPVDRLAVVFVVDLSDSVGTPGSEALAYLRESLAAKQDEDVAGIVAFGSDALVERLPSDLAEIDRIASTPVRDATDIGSALRLAGALFPDDAQKRIVLLSDGNDTTGSGQSEAALAAARGIQVETVLTGLAGRDEVLVQRLTAPSTARRGESVEVSATSPPPSPSPRPSGCSSTASSPAPSRSTCRRGRTRSSSWFTPKDPGSSASGWSSRPPATRSTRTTGPRRTRSSRASPRCSSSRATRRSPPSSSPRSKTEQQRGHGDPRGPAVGPRRPRRLRLDRARRRAAPADHRPAMLALQSTCATSGGAW